MDGWLDRRLDVSVDGRTVARRVNGFESRLFHLYSVTTGKSVSLVEFLLLFGRINGDSAAHPHPTEFCLLFDLPPDSTVSSLVSLTPSPISGAWHSSLHAVGAQ